MDWVTDAAHVTESIGRSADGSAILRGMRRVQFPPGWFAAAFRGRTLEGSEVNELAKALREMGCEYTHGFTRPNGEPVPVYKVGPDEFKVNGGQSTSYPNTVRLLRTMGVEG